MEQLIEHKSLPSHSQQPLLLRLPLFEISRTKSKAPNDTMRFSAISLLCLAAVAVDAAAVNKRDCVEHRGNSWGCDAPAGQPQNWNYCQVYDPSYPVHRSTCSSKVISSSLISLANYFPCQKLCTAYNDGGLTSARCCNM